jgi:threonine/homoserine/homoserine lactone efflux protein
MILALLIGLTVGYVMSIPPGPIAVAVIKNALDGKPREGMQVGFGASTMDTLYSLIAIFASTALVGTLKDAIVGNPIWVFLFQIAAIVTLVVLGVKYIRATTSNVVQSTAQEKAQEDRAQKMGLKSPYFTGMIISIANLASPTFFPLLIGVASYVHTQDLVNNSIAQCSLYALGFGSGAALWFVTLQKVLYRWRKKLSSNFIGIIFKFAGWSFLLFALVLIVEVMIHTEWEKLF